MPSGPAAESKRRMQGARLSCEFSVLGVEAAIRHAL
jgi:hypothetical protein